MTGHLLQPLEPFSFTPPKLIKNRLAGCKVLYINKTKGRDKWMKMGFSIPSLEAQTLIVQASAPGLAVLPILADNGHGDVEYATNVVTTSTVLFAVVVPIVMVLVQNI